MTQSDLDRSPQRAAQFHQCSPDMCLPEGSRDFWHREVPEHFTPREEGDPSAPTVSWSLAQHDELDGVGSVESSDLFVVLGVGREQAYSSLDEAQAYAWDLLRTVARGRRLLGD